MDFAHTETDKAIEELEKRLQAEYRQAYKETKGKLEKYLSDFARKDEDKRKLVGEGKLSQEKYKEWRTNQMLTGQRWTKMVDTLARDMNRTNQIAADIISGQLSPTFALNANFAAYGIENGFRTDYGFTLYNEDAVNRLIEENPDLLPAPRIDIPEDIRWNKQKIMSNITQAVLQGKSIPEIAKAMETVVGMNKASATRNARTAMTGAQNAGRQATYDRANAMGIKVKKEWIATLDGRTRHSHGKADGQQVEIDGKFKVGASELRYPGDFQNGTPEELYNCRCTMATVEPLEIIQGEQPRMTYQEWVQTKEGQETLEKVGKKPQLTAKVESDIILPQAKTVDEAYKMLVDVVGFDKVERSVKKLTPELTIKATNSLIQLEERFGIIKHSDTPSIFAENAKTAAAFVRRESYCTPAHQKLSLCPKFFGWSEHNFENTIRINRDKNYFMPFADGDEVEYIITHEYGHMIQNILIHNRMVKKGLDISNPEAFVDVIKLKSTKEKIRLQAYEWYINIENEIADECYDEIVKIAKERNSSFSLSENLSGYGGKNKKEFFAEVFANSQSSKTNELGDAMNIWLKRKGLIK